MPQKKQSDAMGKSFIFFLFFFFVNDRKYFVNAFAHMRYVSKWACDVLFLWKAYHTGVIEPL